MDMEIVDIIGHGQQPSFTMRGTCPHCHKGSGFVPRSNHGAFIDHKQKPARWLVPMQCQTCTKYILAIATQPYPNNPNHLVYETHYPLGEPDDTVSEEIPVHIQADFKEALRCNFVNAYNATAEMCRRAIEASCIDLGAPVTLKVLEDKIDWLEAQRKITPFLRDVAHKIRLGGNRGAHPPESIPVAEPPVVVADADLGPITVITKEHADAIIQFTREFFHHVYVVPKQLNKYDFSKPKAAKS